ncbi:hypothetical protein PGT21_014850 [Puccinia graminis f. sp. tritici]|uniref:Uncharacterized protein n=1 Tax=Puccinia graminis f. sp. tritici TaxID=56615 RepID=A0A5B0PI07_PUCGR|nr:hypothetical protein PGTUg99_006804 [Puccinia graminis f. sp. tritici]KAA1101267.1 hypothetical protein PGT21_014850 [Puccinia graminis f. sp. tritici]
MEIDAMKRCHETIQQNGPAKRSRETIQRNGPAKRSSETIQLNDAIETERCR